MLKRCFLTVFVALSLASLAIADPITLTLSGPITGNTVGPQSTSNPCIIAGTQCSQPAGFGYNNFDSSGALSEYNMYSTTPTDTLDQGEVGLPYTVSQLIGAVNQTSFDIAIDVNTTGAASETLLLFEVLINGVVAYNYTGPVNIGNVNNNGNGYADYTLGTVDLSGLALTDQVLFHAQWSNAVDGAESFFLVGAQPVAEASPIALLGAGMLVGGLILKRRARKEAAMEAARSPLSDIVASGSIR